ncbi:MAG: RidA family protein [Aquificaceae bacterium]
MREIFTDKAPKPVGPYSQAVVYENLLFVSGQIGIDPNTGKLREGFEEQIRQVFKNIDEILLSIGISRDKILRVVVYMTNLSEFKKFNEVYEEYFSDVKVKPVRTTVGVCALPLEAQVEIEVIASVS